MMLRQRVIRCQRVEDNTFLRNAGVRLPNVTVAYPRTKQSLSPVLLEIVARVFGHCRIRKHGNQEIQHIGGGLQGDGDGGTVDGAP
jgi:hypothetical protein